MPSPEGEKVSASHETLCPTKKSCSEDALRMDLSLVRGINNAGPVGKRHRGNSVCIPAPSHMANWSQRAWKGCRLMAIINSTKRLARGRHQTGSSPGSDPQQVCRALAVPGAESQRAFRFKETHILPQNPAAPICCSIPGTNRPHKSQILSTGCLLTRRSLVDAASLQFPHFKNGNCAIRAQLMGRWPLLLQGGSLNAHNPMALGAK